MKRIYSVILVALLVTTVFVFTACRRDTATGRTRKDTLVFALHAMPTNLDPAFGNDMPSIGVMLQMYDTLVTMDFDMNHAPGAAERWQFENDAQGNPTRVRFFLKRGIKFHNGDDLTAHEVKFSLDRAVASPITGFITGNISGVEVINDYELVVTTAFPFVPILNNLAHPLTSLVSSRAVREAGHDLFGQSPVGSGPYRVTNIVAGDRIELTRWEGYHGTPARIENLVVRVMTDLATRQIELETGGVDIIWNIPASDLARNMAHPDVQVMRGPNFQTDFIMMNTSRQPFNDIRVRQAMNYAIDSEALVNSVWRGVGGVANGPLTSNVWASLAGTGALPPYTYNPARARELLAEAGYPNGFNTTIWLNEVSHRVDIAEITQNMLREVGVNVDISIMEWGAVLERTGRGEHDMMIVGWVTVTGDPDYGLHPTHHSVSYGAHGNRSFWSTPETDRLLDQGRAEPDPVRRAAIYDQVQRIAWENAPWIYVWSGESVNALRADVRGFRIHPSASHPLWTVYFED